MMAICTRLIVKTAVKSTPFYCIIDNKKYKANLQIITLKTTIGWERRPNSCNLYWLSGVYIYTEIKENKILVSIV